MMTSKSTVAVDEFDRKKIRKISALLDISQGEVIHLAIKEFENKILTEKMNQNKLNNELSEIDKILKKATDDAYSSDPNFMKIQEELFTGPETIDDFILDEWDSGLEGK